MRVGLVSESLVLGGIYLISNANPTLGGICLGTGVFGGIFSFLYNVTLNQATEKRRTEAFEISKGLLHKLLQVINDIGHISQKPDHTVH